MSTRIERSCFGYEKGPLATSSAFSCWRAANAAAAQMFFLFSRDEPCASL